MTVSSMLDDGFITREAYRKIEPNVENHQKKVQGKGAAARGDPPKLSTGKNTA